MHPLSRRRFLTLSSAAAATGLLSRLSAQACCSPGIQPSVIELAKSINTFAGELLARLAKDGNGSLFFSPFSIETALAMTAAGARGETLKEMEKTLHLPADPHPAFGELIRHLNAPALILAYRDDPNLAKLATSGLPPVKGNLQPLALGKRAFELTVANAIWAQDGFPWRKEFVNLLATNYGGGLIEVDFAKSEAARTRINEWVGQSTHKAIKNLIGPGVITGLTRMVLANAIYFKGNWQYQFDKNATRDAPFTRLDKSKVDVPLMYQTAELKYGQTHVGGQSGDSVQFLELPYAGQALSMLILLPGEPRMAERLALYLKDGSFIRTEMKMQRVKVWLPRFKAESEFLLNQPLMDMGMKQAFGSADFTGMSPEGKSLAISHVLHKAFVDVNEEGTEAAAATAVAIKQRSLPRETIFRADRPFVYVIRDNKTGAALFMGRYMGPKA